MLSRSYAPLLAIVLFTSCQADIERGTETLETVQLRCVQKTTEDGQTVQFVYAEVEYKKVKLAAIESCDIIAKEAFREYKIPQKALMARGGKKDEQTETIYALRKEGQLFFYRKVGNDKQLISTYQNGKFDFTTTN
jgi:hypothetical protein